MGKVTTVPKPLADVEATIRRVAHNSSSVRTTQHALEKLQERGLTMTQVYRCLQSGTFVDGPTLSSEVQMGWKFRMQVLSAGEYVRVVGKLIEQGGDYILVITLF
jgi:hypothetical protein